MTTSVKNIGEGQVNLKLPNKRAICMNPESDPVELDASEIPFVRQLVGVLEIEIVEGEVAEEAPRVPPLEKEEPKKEAPKPAPKKEDPVATEEKSEEAEKEEQPEKETEKVEADATKTEEKSEETAAPEKKPAKPTSSRRRSRSKAAS